MHNMTSIGNDVWRGTQLIMLGCRGSIADCTDCLKKASLPIAEQISRESNCRVLSINITSNIQSEIIHA
jgi:hypothetical protein